MTIYEIKEATKEKSPYFFSRNTLKFFDQTLRGFKIRTSPKENVFIYASCYWRSRLMGYTFREFKNRDLVSIPGVDLSSRLAIEKYIESH